MDNKFSVARVLCITRTEFYKWLINPRMFVAISMLFFIWSFAGQPLVEISKEMNSPLNFIEPFIAVLNSRVLCLITPATYLFLISDYPHLDRSSLFILHRVHKREWVAGQFAFFIMSSLLFIIMIFIFTVLLNAHNSFVANGWSLVVTRYGIYNPEKSSSFAATLITKELYNQIAPYQAAIISFLLNWLYMILLGLILLLFHVLNLKKIGVPVLVGIIGIGSALGVFDSRGKWFFPMAHTMIKLHYTKYLRQPIMDIWVSFVYFIILILLALFVSLSAIKNTNFLDIDESE